MKNPKRFLPERPSGKGGRRKLTREQVTQAVLAFKTRGGLIKELPPQPEGNRAMIGHRWDSMYEAVFDRF